MVILPGCVCCGAVCSVSDGIPRSDPKDEGNWTPSGTWKTGVTWTYNANPGDDSGETWYFYGSSSTSGGVGGLEIFEWGNICNWWSSRNVSPSELGSALSFVKRATRFPPTSAIVYIYSAVNTSSVGPQTVKELYVWNGRIMAGSAITATGTAHDTSSGTVFNNPGSFPALLDNTATISGGAQLNGPNYAFARGTINGGAVFYGFSFLGLGGTVNGGATFNDDATIGENGATVNGGATFNDRSFAFGVSHTINGGAVFNNQSTNSVTVLGGAVFNDSTINNGTVYDGAVFNDSSEHHSGGTVYGGATFNDAACSRRTVGARTPLPCTKKFVAHPTDLPTCSGTALTGCHATNSNCGCG